jgi:hypothetical protein
LTIFSPEKKPRFGSARPHLAGEEGDKKGREV